MNPDMRVVQKGNLPYPSSFLSYTRILRRRAHLCVVDMGGEYRYAQPSPQTAKPGHGRRLTP